MSDDVMNNEVPVIEDLNPDGYWDVIQVLRDQVIKVRVKIMLVRDGLDRQNLWYKIAKEVGLKQEHLEQDVEAMFLIQHWPLIRYGTENTEGVNIPQTKEEFEALPEVLVLEWSEAIKEANPQYAVSFMELRRTLDALFQTESSTASETTSTDDGNDS